MRGAILTFVLASSVIVTGCTALDSLDRRFSSALNPPKPAPVVTAEPSHPVPERKPTDVPPAKERPSAQRTAKRTEPPKPQPVPDATQAGQDEVQESKRTALPEDLVGLSADQLRARFGAPEAEIEETPGVVWRYRGQDCVLDVHLFPRVESQGLYALDATARGKPVAECLASLGGQNAPASAQPADAVPSASVGDS